METQPFLCRAVQTLHYRQHSCFSLSLFHSSFKQKGKAFPPREAQQFLPQTLPAQIKPLCCGDGDHSPAGPLGGMHCTPGWTGWGTFREHSALSGDTSSLKDYQLAALILGICRYQTSSRHFVSLNQNGLVVFNVPMSRWLWDHPLAEGQKQGLCRTSRGGWGTNPSLGFWTFWSHVKIFKILLDQLNATPIILQIEQQFKSQDPERIQGFL